MTAAPQRRQTGRISGPIIRGLREEKVGSRSRFVERATLLGYRISLGRLTEIETADEPVRVTLATADIFVAVLGVPLEQLRG